ncbi:uncharacterized protein TrAFT101_007919 [Trichoderma asperellum]|uniref:SnoaL-like domain-containing protein n=1 Tax=Trichoderma asperellum (strain ATCC 204424 / CBS 433.97 / NBRC 101777) TaxID=1042311 RepID=A0A2T3Z3B2_TRIA4|nr:hypothetical protein M441DRAFT_28441 [Trichoderma asperellum CBS 433.97]PTB39285.1 hypothetical protein M441DRAFT_28441 [Trichoderma asperellum CBS 433.97]UKZ92987.1 hypothetical protein TrAFT101_007919 [Trichoderma asperellum]
MSASQDSKNSALFNWLSEAWVKILFQPDDDLAVNTFNKTFANDIVIKINHDHVTREEYLAYITSTRAAFNLAFIHAIEVKVWESPNGGGSLVFDGELKYVDKKTKEEQIGHAIMILDIRSDDNGELKVVQTTECVTRSAGSIKTFEG